MKNIMKKIKLNILAQNAMKEREMNHIKGGNFCGCGCNYAGTSGGSSISSNMNANYDGNLTSPGGIKIFRDDKGYIVIR
jgi:natural product precursor